MDHIPGVEQEFNLRWNNHESNLCSVLDSMLKREVLVDTTLSCAGKSFKAHRAVLSACSPYFEQLFADNVNGYPIIVLRDVHPEEMDCLIGYMYSGQVTISHSKLAAFLKIAETLQIRGLANHTKHMSNHAANDPHQEAGNGGGDVDVDEPRLEPWINGNPPMLTESNVIPLSKRKRHYSDEYIQNIPKLLQIKPPQPKSTSPLQENLLPVHIQNAPTDLSFRKGEVESDGFPAFRPVITSVFNSTSGNNAGYSNLNHLNFKAKEFAVSPKQLENSEDFTRGRIMEEVRLHLYFIISPHNNICISILFFSG